MKIKRLKGLKGTISVPGDKSISHRSIMLGSIAEGTTEVHNFLQGADCLSSIACFRQMGIDIENNGDIVRIHGQGLHGLKRPENTLDTGNSGTTTRLMSGILAGQNRLLIVNRSNPLHRRHHDRQTARCHIAAFACAFVYVVLACFSFSCIISL